MTQQRRPYKLPEPLTCDPNEIVDGRVPMSVLDKYMLEQADYLPRYIYLEAMYKGFHDVYKAPEKPEWKPDNRMAVNFPRYITDVFCGYAYGVPIDKTHPDESIDERMRKFEKSNETADHESTLAKYVSIYGHAWEYFYQTPDAETRITACTPRELFVVYDDTIEKHGLFMVRHGIKADGVTRYGEVATPEYIRRFEGADWIDEIPNPYGYLPCVEWRMNDDRIGLYEQVTGLVEQYNHTISEKANDVDAFAEAYLAILGADVDDEGIRRIRDDRVINLYGTDDASQVLVQFLTKPSADGTQENLLDRLEKNIYQMSMVVNLSDDTFGNSISGEALSYKLKVMSDLAISFDRKIAKSLRKRYKIFCSLPTNVPDSEAWREMDFRFSRNLPKNVQNEATIAAQLEGIVSKETQLSAMPSIVPDPKVEMERIEAEEESQTETRYSRVFAGNQQEQQVNADELA